MNESYEVNGLKELNKALKQFSVEVERKILRSIVQAGGQVVVKAAKENVPVDSGALRDGIIRRAAKGAKTPGKVVVNVGTATEVFYGVFLELGTSSIPATPWLRPALDDNVSKIITAMRKRAEKRIEREAEKAAQKAGSLKYKRR